MSNLDPFVRRANSPKYRVFCALGGSASSRLHANIRDSGHFQFCHARPDLAFRPREYASKKEDILFHESSSYQLIESLEEFPNVDGLSFFKRRTNFLYKNEETIKEYLRRYFQSLATAGGAAVLATAGCANLISEAGIENAMFLVRHPLHSLLSWGKPRRHKKDLDRMGGPESLNVVLQWSHLWNSHAQEYFLCKERNLNPRLIRFEYSSEDVDLSADPVLADLFKNWKPELRNSQKCILPNFLIEKLEELVGENYYKIYSDWNI